MENRALEWLRGDLSYKLHTIQKKIHGQIRDLPPEAREALVFCSRRLGKSYLAVVMALEDCLQGDDKRVMIVAPNLKQAMNIVVPLVRMIIEDAPEGMVKQTKSEYRWRLANGSELIMGGFDTAIESFRGTFAHSIYLEESGVSSAEEYDYIIKSVLMPTLMHSRGRIVHLTTPSREIDHPLHIETIPSTQANGAFFCYTIRDNPLLTPDIIEQEIEALGGLDSAHTQRELFCKIVRDDSITAVPQFDENRHVQKVDETTTYWWVGGDIGGVRDKSVLLLCSYDDRNGRIYVDDERVFESKTPTSVIRDGGLEMERGLEVYRAVDAPGQLFVDLSATYDYPCFLPEKLHFDQNMQRIQTAFYHNEIVINPRCKFLIASLRNGQLNKQRTDFARTEALGHCDAIAALVYAIRHADKRVKAKKPNKADTFSIKPPPEAQFEAALKSLRFR